MRLLASRRQAEANSRYRKQSRKPHGRRDRGCWVAPRAKDLMKSHKAFWAERLKMHNRVTTTISPSLSSYLIKSSLNKPCAILRPYVDNFYRVFDDFQNLLLRNPYLHKAFELVFRMQSKHNLFIPIISILLHLLPQSTKIEESMKT